MAQTDEEMDAIAMLKADHRKVEEFFAAFEKATGKSKTQALADQICEELKVHTVIEEEIFYPACKGQIEEDLLKEAYVEHDGAKLLINEIEAASPEDDFYHAEVKVLSEMIEHHVGEEEMRSEGMFSQARAAVSTWTCWPNRCAPARKRRQKNSRPASPPRPAPFRATRARTPIRPRASADAR